MSFAKKILIVAGAVLTVTTLTISAAAQGPTDSSRAFAPDDPIKTSVQQSSIPPLVTPVALPRMAPELALVTYEYRAARQNNELGTCTDTVTIYAELPDTSQKGEFEVKRAFAAPKKLTFAAIKFVGDTFVKTNVILRVLQSEQDHVQKDNNGDLSLNRRNYKFTYKSTQTAGGRTVYVFDVKPKQKRVGLFKGKVQINAYTGSLVRVEGTLVKSPSWFLKKVEFAQDYADFGDYTFPVHIHSNAKARIIGRTVVDIYHRDYQARSVNDLPQQGVPTATAQTPNR